MRSDNPEANYLDRVPPQNNAAEQAALGAMLLEREAIEVALDLALSPKEFYRDLHQLIFHAILALYRQREPVDLITLGTYLRARPHNGGTQLDAIGGAAYLQTIMTVAPTAAGMARYCHILRECYTRREMIRAADRMLHRAFTLEEDLPEQLRASEADAQRLTDLALGGAASLPDLEAVLRGAIAVRKQADLDGVSVGFKTGWKALNKLLMPFRPGELIVVAGRPGMGKSALAWQLARHSAERAGQVAAFFSLEMDQDALALRAFQAGGMDAWKVNRLDYRVNNPLEIYRDGMERIADEAHGVRFRLLDVANLNPQQLEHHARVIRREEGSIGVVVVDYLQLMGADNPRVTDLFEVTSKVSRALKALAMSLKCVVVAISQLSREVERRTPPRPQLADLRQSGQIEQDADKVIFLYRPGAYGKAAMALAERQEEDETELILAKQRNGPTGGAWVRFVPARVEFEDLEGGQG